MRSQRQRTTINARMLCAILFSGVLGCGRGLVAIEDALPVDAASAAGTHYSVMSFGAKGDGVTDDAAAIEKAMQAAAHAGGGQVVFPCGEFAVKSLQGGAPGGRSALYLQGANAVQMVGAGSCTHVFTSLAQVSLLELASSQQVAVSAMRLTALNAQYVETYGMDGGSAVRFTGVRYGSVSHVEIDGAAAGAIYFTAGTTESSASANNIHDTYGAGIWEDDCGAANNHDCNPSKPSTNNVYEGNTLLNTTLAMLSAINTDDGNGVSGAVIRGNTVSWTHAPLAGHVQVQCIQVNNASGVTVEENQCSGSPWNGIVVTTGPGGRCADVTIEGNTITSTGASATGSGIVIYNAPKGLGVSGFVVERNTITTVAGDGITVFADQTPGLVSGGQVVSNTIAMADQQSPGSRYGIDIEHSANITATGNQISCDGSCIAAGVNVKASAGTSPKATDNLVTNIAGVALRLSE